MTQAFKESESIVQNMKDNGVDVLKVEDDAESGVLSIVVDDKEKDKKGIHRAILSQEPAFGCLFDKQEGFDILHIIKNPEEYKPYIMFYIDALNFPAKGVDELMDMMDNLDFDVGENREQFVRLQVAVCMKIIAKKYDEDIDYKMLAVYTRINEDDIKQTYRANLRAISKNM